MLTVYRIQFGHLTSYWSSDSSYSPRHGEYYFDIHHLLSSTTTGVRSGPIGAIQADHLSMHGLCTSLLPGLGLFTLTVPREHSLPHQ